MKKNKKPRISANKLGEYIESSPSRRRKIVMDQKYPKGYVVTRYNDARKTIIDYFTKGKGSIDVVKSKVKDLILTSYSSSFRNQDNRLSIEALEFFADSDLTLDLSKHTVTRFNDDLNQLSIDGVDVSIHPEILIKGEIRGIVFLGAIKIHISKNNSLNQESGKYVATLIHKFLEKNYPSENVRPDFCISMDIFTGKYFTAPKAFKLLRKDIEAACSEIRLLWSDL